ncbi:hypothetical protein DPMN_085537 [Dreissena polymorpha]|uniref:Uncharacterized protein n=1 Tax=Dreissena polymorpha TaxID=45954 RepID=A0A9D3YDX5_DREPO|nr:hypothetical protein DPMN_085537 [Dreissena polymorpha]
MATRTTSTRTLKKTSIVRTKLLINLPANQYYQARLSITLTANQHCKYQFGDHPSSKPALKGPRRR